MSSSAAAQQQNKTMVAIAYVGTFELSDRTYDRYGSITGLPLENTKDINHRSNPTLIKVLYELKQRALNFSAFRIVLCEVDTSLLPYYSVHCSKKFGPPKIERGGEKLVFDAARFISDKFPTPDDIAKNSQFVSELLKNPPQYRIIDL